MNELSLSFLIVILYLVVPLFSAIIAFKFNFPKSIVRISDAKLIPMSVPIILVSNYFQNNYIYQRFIDWLNAASKEKNAGLSILDLIYGILSDDYYKTFYFLISLWVMPFILSFIISRHLRFCYDWKKTENSNYSPIKFWNIFRELLGNFVEDNILHSIASLTAYLPEKEKLIVDIRRGDETLFNGHYRDYTLKDGEFSGLVLQNAIRYKEYMLPDGKEMREGYVIPNRGTIFIPTKEIKDMHFWKLKVGHTFVVDKLDYPYQGARLVWYVALQQELEHMKIKIKVLCSPPENKSAVHLKIMSSFRQLQLDAKKVEIEWAEPPKLE